MDTKTYSIKEAGNYLAVQSYVLRYYEKELGLVILRNAQGHRVYSTQNLEMIRRIIELRDQGIELKHIKSKIKDLGCDTVEALEKAGFSLNNATTGGIEPQDEVSVIENNKEELEESGYKILKGSQLKNLKDHLKSTFGTDINVGTKTTILAILSFRAVLNLAMLLSESEKAKEIRKLMLDVSLAVLAQKTNGNITFINQRDSNFLTSSYREDNTRKEFTNSLINL